MKKMFTRFLLLSVTTLLFSDAIAQIPTIYASVSSGNYNSSATWETFTNTGNNTPGAQGSGTPAASTPSGTHFVYIRSGHTISMNGGGRSCYGMFIEAGGKLWANEATARRLQLVNGGTGFSYPQSGTITNNGEMGGPTDGLFFETGAATQNVTLTGTGSTIVQRFRVPGGNAGQVVNITIDMDITFTQANNYAFALAYNPQPTDNYSMTLTPGHTLTVSNAGGYFNSNSLGSGSAFGTYTYNINGTLDLSASTQTTNNLTAFSNETGTVNLNLNGALKTGAAFNSSPLAPGVANLTIADGVTVDATLATVMNFNGNSFIMAGATSALSRTIPNDGTKITYPVATAAGSYSPVSISNTTGAADVVRVSLKNTFTNPAPASTLPREWNLVETTPGGNSDTLRFEWTTAEEANGFSGANPVFVGRWNGTAWDFTAASVSGSGTPADPYIARGNTAFSSLGLFILSNTGTTPVAFVNVRAYQRQNGIQVEFGNATESDIVGYEIEKSADGRNFSTLTALSPKTNNGGLNSYAYFDAVAQRGANFYRIKVTERDGSVKYSNVLNVRLAGNASAVSVYPNPVKGGTINIQLENLDKANYFVNLYNQMGQKVFTKQLNHDGRTASFIVELPSSLSKGIYNLQVMSNAYRAIKNVVVE